MVARRQRYDGTVYLAPPWPAIFGKDAARRHGLDVELAEYRRLRRGYRALGYRGVVLPRIPIKARADWLLAHLTLTCPDLTPKGKRPPV